jgi:hypothetical protein
LRTAGGDRRGHWRRLAPRKRFPVLPVLYISRHHFSMRHVTRDTRNGCRREEECQ